MLLSILIYSWLFTKLLGPLVVFNSAGSIPKLFDSDFIIGTIFDFDYGRFWQIFMDRFFFDFDPEKLSQNRRFFDSSILIKINPGKKLVFLSFLSQKLKFTCKFALIECCSTFISMQFINFEKYSAKMGTCSRRNYWID